VFGAAEQSAALFPWRLHAPVAISFHFRNKISRGAATRICAIPAYNTLIFNDDFYVPLVPDANSCASETSLRA
jgi:hypothetical protein